MDIQRLLHEHDFILAEAAVTESIRRTGEAALDPRLGNSLLIYEEDGRRVLSRLYHDFIALAREADVPIVLGSPTWRANQERLTEADIKGDVNGDSVAFLKDLSRQWGSWKENILIGGAIGCKNDSYKPAEGLLEEEARTFHGWQIDRLASAGVDFLLAETLPAVPEASGLVPFHRLSGQCLLS
ncbi:MAG: homocysteine S-methyltransferase family protein [Desulfohalobiaceae bacterium]|nr:homocysteine S-methyltransferase family protein [Desulfohalobiaceae bacterium]